MADTPPIPRGPDAVTHQLPAGELPAGWHLLEGQYEIVRLIASGGFGITYLARDTLGRDVAVKECFPLGLAQRAAMTHTVSATSAGTSEHFETARAQFLREARMLAGLRHPNVVHVQTLFEENGTAYMAMDFIHGRDLHEELAGDALPPVRVLELARDLLGALDYVHAQGVLHRDIKPQNIRIDSFGMPLLIDFGAARAETQARSRMAGTFRVVTDGYSPHEFYVSGAKQGPHSDLYALAATLHHVITGAAPIAADERASAMATGQADPYTPIAGRYPAHDARLLQLIDRALRMTPADRPKDAREWLTALTDARTTMVAAPVAAAPGRSRLVPGVLLGAGLMGAVGGGIWAMQPGWLSPGMSDMSAEMAALESDLALAQDAQRAAEGALATVEGTLVEAEAELARLEAANGDMAATLEELDEARAARDAAAAQVADLREELALRTATATALAEAEAARDAALAERDAAQTLVNTSEMSVATATAARAEAEAAQAQAEAARIAAEAEARALAIQLADLDTATTTDRARITALEASLAEATSRLVESRTTEALLTRAEAELSRTQEALNSANVRAATLAAELAQGGTLAGDLAAAQATAQELEAALTASEAARASLTEELTALQALPDTGPEIAALRNQISTLEAENTTLRDQIIALEAAAEGLRADLERSNTALTEALQTVISARGAWAEQATLRAPNGTFALLPRFSWDNRRIAAVDSTGGIALYDRRTGAYEAHLARGIPDRVVRLGFSAGGSYLIATTPNGSANRLYDVRTRREILRFNPVTVTTANRAISSDEQFFVFTRAGAAGQVDIVVTQLASLRTPGATPVERVLGRVADGTPVRIAFAETSNEINILTPDGVQIFEPDGRLIRSGPNRIGNVAALSPIGGDQGFLVLRRTGEVMIYDNLTSQTQVATVSAGADYTLYRLSGDRLSFLRAGDETWDVIDLLTGELRGSGPIDAGARGASISISADGAMIFIGATDQRSARLLDVVTGLEIQDFGDAVQGYFSFDNTHLATGSIEGQQAQIWRLEGADPGGCVAIARAMDGIPILPNTLTRQRFYDVQAGGDVPLMPCAEVQDGGLAAALARTALDLTVTEAPDVAINMLGTARPYRLSVAAEGTCTPAIVVRFGDDWSFSDPGAPGTPITLFDTGARNRPLDVWLATPAGVACDARIILEGEETP